MNAFESAEAQKQCCKKGNNRYSERGEKRPGTSRSVETLKRTVFSNEMRSISVLVHKQAIALQ